MELYKIRRRFSKSTPFERLMGDLDDEIESNLSGVTIFEKVFLVLVHTLFALELERKNLLLNGRGTDDNEDGR